MVKVEWRIVLGLISSAVERTKVLCASGVIATLIHSRPLQEQLTPGEMRIFLQLCFVLPPTALEILL